eukprot:TRINITY_DN63864_c0_g1_i1.p1 TRINITY_DN63864_c0_g1~~TRINITY_DN63864_c0_g1_i1.p1  ORF type:complete len:471 (+),score=165.98 TRINITY_DN63864_c0_g1_i1:85-1497(+)
MAAAAAAPAAAPVLSPANASTRAAMRVLGVVPKDLEPISREAFDTATRFEKHEKRRQDLIGKVSSLAEANPARDDAAFQHGGSGSMQSSFMEAVAKREQANMIKMNQQADKEIKRIILDELAQKEQAEAAHQKQEEAKKKMLELKKERAAQLAQLRKEAEKRKERSDAARAKAKIEQLERSAQLFEELQATFKKKEARLAAMAEEWRQGRIEGQQKGAIILAKKEQLEDDLWCERERNYDSYLDKHAAHSQRIQDIIDSRESNAEALNQKLASSIKRSREKKEATQAEKDAEYIKTMAKFDAAQDYRVKVNNELLTDFRKKNAKERNDFERRYEYIRERELEPKTTRSMQRGERSASDPRMMTMMEFNHGNEVLREVVDANRKQLLRARSYATNQALDAIQLKRDKVTALQESQRQIERRRAEARISCAALKEELGRKVDRVRNAPKSKMDTMLEEFGLKQNKGEDEEEK